MSDFGEPRMGVMSNLHINNPNAVTMTRKKRSDAGKHRNAKTAASALIDTIAALQGLSDEDIRKVLSAASIFLGVANFEPKQ